LLDMVGSSLRVIRASSVLSLAVLVACGGRTTGLQPGDADLYPSVPSDGGSSGSAGKAGSGSGGKAGGPSIGTAGSAAGGGGSVPSGGASQGGSGGAIDLVGQACDDYCRFAGPEACGLTGVSYSACFAECAQFLYPSGPSCQKAASQFFSCVDQSYQQTHLCLGFTACAALTDAYSAACTDTDVLPDPGPTPVPTTCSTTSSSSSSNCSLDMKCNDGTHYNVNCNQSGPNVSACSCKSTNGNSGGGGVFSLNESVSFACFDGLSVCGFPQPGFK